jgi:two-component system sensor histidine kinase EvgS
LAKILVCQDDELDRQIAEAAFAGTDHQVLFARDGLSTLIAFDDAANVGRPFDAALLDCQMPGQSGHELAEAIRTLECGRAVKLVLCSSTGDGVPPPVGTQFDAVLFKPFAYSALLEALTGSPVDQARTRLKGSTRR